MDDDDLYDEFGNYIGDASDSDSSNGSGLEIGENPAENGYDESGSSEDEQNEQDEEEDEEYEHEAQEDDEIENALIKTDDIMLRFAGAETIVVDLTQAEEQPVIRAALEKKLHVEFGAESDEELPTTTYSKEYMLQLAQQLPERIRNVAVMGNLHTGKTSLIDSLVLETHPSVTVSKRDLQDFKPLRYLDTHVLERGRGISIFAQPMTLLLADSKDRSYILNMLDCPGHPDFADETSAMLAAADGAILVLDVVEGLTKRDKRYITSIVKRNIPFLVVLNKIDRLILEQRLPITDFYLKIRYILDDVNACLYYNEFAHLYSHKNFLTPLEDDVIFASSTFRLSFTLSSFAELYKSELASLMGEKANEFEKLLWGDVFYNEESRRFSKDKKQGKRTFEHFVLEPLYKLITYSITTDSKKSPLSKILWENFGLRLHKSELAKDPQDLLRVVLSETLGSTKGLVSLIAKKLPLPHTLHSRYPELEQFSSNETLAEIIKVSPSTDYKSKFALVKVIEGALTVGQKLKIIEEDASDKPKSFRVESLLVPCGRYKLKCQSIGRGMLAYLPVSTSFASRTATLISETLATKISKPRHCTRFGEKSFFKVAIEPENPIDLPRLVEGLRSLSQYYLSIVVKLEESGEHVVLAPGELYLDCFLHDLRNSSDDYLSIKVSDPMVRFSETCSERSATKLSSYGPSKKTYISITAEPVIDKHLSESVEKGLVDLSQPNRGTAKILRNDYGWDSLAARSLWVLGPKDMQQPSLLLDDTLEGETDKENLAAHKDAITTGFKLGVDEGPLCDEPIRNVKFKILDAVLSSSNLKSHGSQAITMTRNAVHTGMLTAAPRLLEPLYRVTIICTYKSINAVQIILDKRRGWIVSENPLPATQLFELEGFVPVLDSVGLDTDMRLQTQGQAMCLAEFSRWKIVPGEPLDKSVPLPNLKPVPKESMARDFVMKTRKRKGLSGEPNLQKYIDPNLYSRLRESGLID